MAEARVERRLAAILAADVCGYSRLMGIDEEGTLAALKAYRREIIDPKIVEHRGLVWARYYGRSHHPVPLARILSRVGARAGSVLDIRPFHTCGGQ